MIRVSTEVYGDAPSTIGSGKREEVQLHSYSCKYEYYSLLLRPEARGKLTVAWRFGLLLATAYAIGSPASFA